MYSHILIPTDGSDLSAKAVQHGVGLAKALSAKVTILFVTAPLEMYSPEVALIQDSPDDYAARVAEHAAKILAAAAATATAAGVAVDTLQIEDGRPYEAIIEAAASKGADLIVMSSHGRRGIEALILGSETAKVLTHCNIPVLVHR